MPVGADEENNHGAGERIYVIFKSGSVVSANPGDEVWQQAARATVGRDLPPAPRPRREESTFLRDLWLAGLVVLGLMGVVRMARALVPRSAA
jgi:hypothetical protein